MLFLQDAGRTKLAQTIAALTIHLAIGRGLPAWDRAPEPPPATATQLVDEIGRQRVIDITYVINKGRNFWAFGRGEFNETVLKSCYSRAALLDLMPQADSED